jgi:hypothetical protein
MQRDILFIASGIPAELHVQYEHFFMAAIHGDALEFLNNLANCLPDLKQFLSQGHSSLIFIGVRNDCETQQEAVSQAWQTFNGIVDGYALAPDSTVPAICHIVFVRQCNSPDATVMGYAETGWAELGSDIMDSKRAWDETKRNLFERIRQFIDVATIKDVKHETDLCRQMLYSAKMFRHGSESKIYGINYLCKFSALEGMVCGSERNKKEALLKKRLGLLFRKNGRNIEAEIEALWQQRCEASHQAKAFYFRDDPNSCQLGAYIQAVEYLFRGTIVFALDNIDNMTTVPQLWAEVVNYELPDYATADRPPEFPKWVVNSALIDYKLKRQIGFWFDTGFAQASKLLADQKMKNDSETDGNWKPTR